jgi:cephalosporin hydroxylase
MDIVDNERTDKNTTHSYLPLYENLLKNKKDTAKMVMEIGICNGGSIKLWRDYFQQATVYGADIMHMDYVWDQLKNDQQIVLMTSTDAYHPDVINTIKDKKFDFIIDDGPHTLESMIVFVRDYSQLLSENGILILEDVQDYEWFDSLIEHTPDDLKKYIEIYDLRQNKGRYDDLVFVIKK